LILDRDNPWSASSTPKPKKFAQPQAEEIPALNPRLLAEDSQDYRIPTSLECRVGFEGLSINP
jgi:hypothetical protein